MKIDLKKLEGRELDAEVAGEPRSVWHAYGFGRQDRGHGWIAVAGAPLVIGGICAAIGWNAFLAFLGFAGFSILLLGGAVIWIISDTEPFV